MKRVLASLCLCWLAWCGALHSNALPLKFGMTPAEASAALGLPLILYSGSRRSELYIAAAPAGIPGFYPTDFAIALQFRGGHLSGWKKDWHLHQWGPF